MGRHVFVICSLSMWRCLIDWNFSCWKKRHRSLSRLFAGFYFKSIQLSMHRLPRHHDNVEVHLTLWRWVRNLYIWVHFFSVLSLIGMSRMNRISGKQKLIIVILILICQVAGVAHSPWNAMRHMCYLDLVQNFLCVDLIETQNRDRCDVN